MTDETNTDFELSRRKILGAAGTVGAAGALGGAATTGLLWDEEQFGNATNPNVLGAGKLDLKADWEEHYAEWLGAETAVDGVRMLGDGESPGENEVGLPMPGNAMVAVRADDTDDDNDRTQIDEFMDATAIEAYPDSNDDGIQDDITTFAFCENGADMPEDLDSDLRTQSARGDPLVDLTDVKPGDFGELTLSFHLCGNPAYVSLVGELVQAAENGITEPEGEAPDEDGEDAAFTDLAEAREKVELLEAVQTAWWYDNNCNNLLDAGEKGGGGKADIAFVFDRSFSMEDDRNFLRDNIKNVTGEIEDSGIDARYAMVPYEEGTNGQSDGSPCATFVATPLTDNPDDISFSWDVCGGDENASEAIQFTLDSLSWRSDAQKILVVLTDEDDDGSTTEREDAINAVDTEEACLLAVSPASDSDGADPNQESKDELRTMAEAVECGDWTDFKDGLSEENISDFVSFVSSVTGGEILFLQDTLGGALEVLSEGLVLDSDPSTDAKDCFPPATQCIGFAWWLPRDLPGIVDNAVQTDSVKFNFGFEAIQCRHNPVGNDGEPMAGNIQEADGDA